MDLKIAGSKIQIYKDNSGFSIAYKYHKENHNQDRPRERHITTREFDKRQKQLELIDDLIIKKASKNLKNREIFEINSIIEKPDIKNAPSNLAVVGRYILQPEIFSLLEKTEADKFGEIQLTEAIAKIMRLQKVLGVEIMGKRYDCGNKFGFLQAQVDFGLDDSDCKENFLKFLTEKVNNLVEIIAE